MVIGSAWKIDNSMVVYLSLTCVMEIKLDIDTHSQVRILSIGMHRRENQDLGSLHVPTVVIITPARPRGYHTAQYFWEIELGA